MPTKPSDAFELFAAEHGLRLSTEAIYSAPRDVLHAPVDSEQCFLTVIRKQSADAEPLRLMFLAPLSEPSPPTFRDILWWLAGDAWALREAEGRLDKWAAGYGYRVTDSATARLFETHARQADALRSLLGSEGYDRLLTAYRAQISESG